MKDLEQFYISCALGFEEEVATEVRECWPWLLELNAQSTHHALPEMKIERGGILLTAPFHLGLQLNFFLKTPHRILWRVAEFRVRDFPKLFEKMRSLPWSQYLASPQVEWVVSAAKSRLNHEKRIEEACQEAFAKSFKGTEILPPQQIYVRLFDDVCTVSLDSSGEHLHKRGWGTQKGEAPLRESIAAFMLRQMFTFVSPGELAQIILVDPFCGSGTLLLEAASLWQPQFQREFSFLNWKITPKLFKSPVWRKNYKNLPEGTPFKSYEGSDIDEKVLQAARANQKDLEAQTDLKALPMQWRREDLFSTDGSVTSNIWCVTNPPYGERLRVATSEAFSYQNLLQKICEKFNPRKLGILLPDKSETQKLKAPNGYEKIQDLRFSNGGLEVVFLLYSRDGE